jgi:formiminotetrahydrofolate cyclodeaminase
MADHDFAGDTLEGFLEALGSDTPTPGGGTAAAVAGAMGASLVAMLARLTIGREAYRSAWPLMTAVADEAASVGRALLELAEEDARAYDAVSAAYRMPKGTDAEQAARTAAIQAALKGATEAPLRVMERCAEVIGLAKNAVSSGNKNALSDGAAGAELARSALKVASYNVRINLASVKDEAFAKEVRARMDEILYMATRVAQGIESQVNDLWKP